MYGHYGFYDQLYQSVNDNPDDSHLYIYICSLIEIWLQNTKPYSEQT